MPSTPLEAEQENEETIPYTPATTLVTSPSPTSEKQLAPASAQIEQPPAHYHSATPIPKVEVKRESVHRHKESCDTPLLPQQQQLNTKQEKHIPYAPQVEMMGKPFQPVYDEKCHYPHRSEPPPAFAPVAHSAYDIIHTMNPLGVPLQRHPYLTRAVIYVNMFPPDIPEQTLADALAGCLPIRVKIGPAVPSEARLLPDMHYDWMSKTGTIEFTSLPLTERALAILINHTTFAPRGVSFSPYPPPHFLPMPEPPTASRYIRPTRLAKHPSLPPQPQPEDVFRTLFPTPADVYDAIRPWGSIRSVNSYVMEAHDDVKMEGQEQSHAWMARVDFWYEEEAKNFDIGFGKTASLLKGWQIFIHAAMPKPVLPLAPMYHQAPSHISSQTFAPPQLPQTPANAQYLPAYNDTKELKPLQMGMMYLPDAPFPPAPISTDMPHFPVAGYDQMPHTPPAINYIPPWAEHNMFAATGYVPEGYMDGTMVPVTPEMSRRMSRTSMSSLNGRGRTWSLTVGESPDGEFKPTGLVADDGTIIQHGPGQHIRPAPFFGPGSNSVSGLVDYSNVFVKNLDPDINSYYLEEVFGNIGQVVSARVMRDDQGRSRGYGFVSFHTPEQAAYAITTLHNQKLGRSTISVTLHEPRKLRPEKIAERMAEGLPVAFGRQSSTLPRRSMSPVRSDRLERVKHSYEEDVKPRTTSDQIRSLSPHSRQIALAKRISSRVRNYARSHGIADSHIEPAIKTLAQQDLSLIPLLNDKIQLDIRIDEAFSSFKPDLKPSLPTKPVVRPTNEDLVQLREEISKIDPVNLNDIMPILLEMLSPLDWETIWTQQRIAKKYGLAKQMLDKRKTENYEPVKSETDEQEDMKKDNAQFVEPPNNDLVPLEGLTIPSFVTLPATKIILNLECEQSSSLLTQLGIIQPTAKEKSDNAIWVDKVMNKSKVERGVEIASILSRKIDVDTLKRSQKLKVIKSLIDAEDEKALCQLIIYPALLNAKVKAFVEGQAKS
ncbi:uncharacterized protein L201_004984 [Kwoniella dendrophila CBS 6074]|uniref:RRM domain-containing protein n=1 Tax=Kwoniella dendrophila CBS 6074 TaxID=1295534 RepID=A0AAX4JXN5_9TREE